MVNHNESNSRFNRSLAGIPLKYLAVTGVLVVGAVAVMFWDTQRTNKTAGGGSTGDNRIGQVLVTTEKLASADKITLAQGDQKSIVAKTAEGNWQVLPATEGGVPFPADAKQVAALLDSLARIKIQELLASRRTGWTGMGLDAPKTLVIGAKDKEIFALNLGDQRRTGGQFVNFSTDEKAFLISEPINAALDSAAWELKNLFSTKPETIKTVAFQPSQKSKSLPVRLVREKVEEQFKVEDLGADTAIDTALPSVASIATDVAFTKRYDLSNEEAKTAFLDPSKVTIDLYDGRVVNAMLGKVEGAEPKYFLKVTVAQGASTAKLDANSEMINQLMDKYAFEVASWIGERFSKGRADFVKKPESAADKPKPVKKKG